LSDGLDELGRSEQEFMAALALAIAAVQALAKVSPEARQEIATALPVAAQSYRDKGWESAAATLEQIAQLLDAPVESPQLLDASVLFAQHELHGRESEED
jgi:hypothetical protein